MIELGFAWLAGVLTIINPCILPVLPIVLASSLKAGRAGPLALTGGLCLTFVTAGMLVSTLGPAIGVREDQVQTVAAAMMVLFGVLMLLSGSTALLARASNGLAVSLDGQMGRLDPEKPSSQLLTGMLLGLVWSPCIGPTLGGAIALASQGQELLRSAAIMLFFSFGIGSVTLALGYGAQRYLKERRARLGSLSRHARPFMAVVLILVGVMIMTGAHYRLEGLLLDIMPEWLLALSVEY